METRTLGELIDTVQAEGPVTPAMQAIVAYAIRLAAVARTHGNTLIIEANLGEPVGVAEFAG